MLQESSRIRSKVLQSRRHDLQDKLLINCLLKIGVKRHLFKAYFIYQAWCLAFSPQMIRVFMGH